MTAYRIVDWNTRYENNRSRDIQNTRWFPCPNDFDGDGYLTMTSGPDGPLAYCGWIVLLAVASRSNPRGSLIQTTGEPHTASSIARKSNLPIRVVSLAIERALSVAWLEEIPQAGAVSNGRQVPSGVRSLPVEPEPEPESEQQQPKPTETIHEAIGKLRLSIPVGRQVGALSGLTVAEINEVVADVRADPNVRKVGIVAAGVLLGRRGQSLPNRKRGNLSESLSVATNATVGNLARICRERMGNNA